MTAIVIYLIMSLFDISVLAGTAYMVQVYSWSPWWFLFAALVLMGSNPQSILKQVYKKQQQQVMEVK